MSFIKISCCFSTLVFSLIVSPLSYGDMGFHFFDDGSSVPNAIKTAPENVFQLVSPSGRWVQLDLNSTNENEREKTINDLVKNRWRPDIRYKSLNLQISNCKNNQIYLCDILIDLKTSTGFVLESPRVFIATYHGAADYIQNLSNQLDASKIKTIERHPFIVLDANGEIASEGSKLIRWNQQENYSGDLLVLDPANLDVNGLRYSKNTTVNRDTTLFAVGFPEATKGRELLGGKNAKLDTLSYSKGLPVSATYLNRSSLIDYMYKHDPFQLSKNSLFVTNLDSHSGMSGGPLLTEDGYVVGMLISALAHKNTHSKNTTKRVTTLFLNLLNGHFE